MPHRPALFRSCSLVSFPFQVSGAEVSISPHRHPGLAVAVMCLRANVSQEAGIIHFRMTPLTHPKSKGLLKMLTRAREKIPQLRATVSAGDPGSVPSNHRVSHNLL